MVSCLNTYNDQKCKELMRNVSKVGKSLTAMKRHPLSLAHIVLNTHIQRIHYFLLPMTQIKSKLSLKPENKI